MSIAWKLSRLSAMDRRELVYRIRKALQTRVEQAGFGLRTRAPVAGVSGRAWVDDIDQEFDVSAYRAVADRILAGRFDIFSMNSADIGFPPLWNKDAKTGTHAPLTFGKLLNYRDERIVGDIKYLWEPNRHLQLVQLAQAAHLTGDPRYFDGCRILLDSWFEQCPFPYGPNWTSSLEHAMRLVNWSFAWHLLGSDGSPLFQDVEGAAFRQRWLSSIYQHCKFIAGYLSRHSSANNHLLGELTGLFVGATTWPIWKPSGAWRDAARRELEEEALKQNWADGVNKEQAIWYHQAVAEMMLLAGLVARGNGCDFGAAYWERLEAMVQFVASLMDSGGNVANFGDADDGVMVRLAPGAGAGVYGSLLATGAVLFKRPDFKAKAGIFDDKSRWLLGKKGAQIFRCLPPDNPQRAVKRAFPQGGYYLLGGDFETGAEVRIVAHAGPLGYLSIAAHGHADALSFTLSVAGQEILIDPGTFAYHTQRIWREYFKGTSAHNTIRVDGQNQSVSAGNFLWVRHANARAETFQSDDESGRLIAHHDGYMRLPDPVQTRREWSYQRSPRQLTITDSLACSARHAIEMFWHFSEHCEVQTGPEAAIVRCFGVEISLRWPADLTARLAVGQEDPPLGWRSRQFDRKFPCKTLVISGEIDRSWRGATILEVLKFGDAVPPILSR